MTSLTTNQLMKTDRQPWRNRGDLNLSQGSSILTPYNLALLLIYDPFKWNFSSFILVFVPWKMRQFSYVDVWWFGNCVCFCWFCLCFVFCSKAVQSSNASLLVIDAIIDHTGERLLLISILCPVLFILPQRDLTTGNHGAEQKHRRPGRNGGGC